MYVGRSSENRVGIKSRSLEFGGPEKICLDYRIHGYQTILYTAKKIISSHALTLRIGTYLSSDASENL